MFGEEDSESPRLGSPWEALSPSPSPVFHPTSVPSDYELELSALGDAIPKLAPEVEQGNVEYKLKLVNPTAERFTRLVTQLKWRLLEGGGQALYEIGVSDSGQLVGLSRRDLHDSLDTLERMADELGATVIIVKEISIPALMIDQAGLRVQQRIDGGARLPRKRLDDVSEGEGGMPGVVTDTDTSEAEDFVSSVITPVDSGIDLALLTSSTPPRPIIRTYPYGNTPYMNRGSAGLRIVQPCSIPSAAITTDFDDDPAFAFDLDISTFPVKPTANDIVVPAIPVVPVPVARGPKDKGFVKTQKRYNTPKPPAPTRTGGFKSAKPITPTPTAVVVPVPVVNNLIPISVLKDEDEHTGDLRLIVEALVVRKLSVEEAFLDFGGFTLE